WGHTQTGSAGSEWAQPPHGSRELAQAGAALRGVRSEHFLIVDAARPEARQCLEGGAGTARVRDARDARRPTVAHPLLGRAGELCWRARVLQDANRANPRREFPLGVLAGEEGQLEVGVTVHQAGD